MNTKIKYALAVSLLAGPVVFSTAQAGELIYLDVGQDIDGPLNLLLPAVFFGDPNNITDSFRRLNLNFTATSVYTERAGGIDNIINNGEILDFTDTGSVRMGNQGNRIKRC
ncbi:hypothetical protein [Thiocystis violascens]|uniref:Uncharacterized protein n=1 Tax=Thiocystis violascens (strain ATCC 17096 / DSM 198 / 6111) TaxID=765911 RepID=I3YGG7_THIV6|nr:hypothetical protein [Thiocystis violascens]AFL76085.1 hypothetical protein Thivi_4272 [Thiocystis violascens DSM 198]